MKTLASFTGKVLTYNPDGISRVQLTDLSNGNSCETDSNSTALKEAGVNYNGCEFEIVVVEEHGHPKGTIRKIEPKPASEQPTSFDI